MHCSLSPPHTLLLLLPPPPAGIKLYYGPDTYYGEEVSVLEMDGAFDKLEELIYIESHLSNTSSKFYGEITQQARTHARMHACMLPRHAVHPLWGGAPASAR